MWVTCDIHCTNIIRMIVIANTKIDFKVVNKERCEDVTVAGFGSGDLVAVDTSWKLTFIGRKKLGLLEVWKDILLK